MSNATKKSPITYDSSVLDKFILKKDGEELFFNRSPSGLYFRVAGAHGILMVGTTKENCEGYTS